jgi:hypothetical protein
VDESEDAMTTTTPETVVQWPAWEDPAFYNQDPW